MTSITKEDFDKGIGELTAMIGDLAQMMHDGFTALNERMDRLEARMDSLEERMDRLEATSREHTAAIKELTERVSKVEGQLGGIDDDIRYLYNLVDKLKRDIKAGKLTEEETRSRLEQVEAIAERLVVKFGVKI